MGDDDAGARSVQASTEGTAAASHSDGFHCCTLALAIRVPPPGSTDAAFCASKWTSTGTRTDVGSALWYVGVGVGVGVVVVGVVVVGVGVGVGVVVVGVGAGADLAAGGGAVSPPSSSGDGANQAFFTGKRILFSDDDDRFL